MIGIIEDLSGGYLMAYELPLAAFWQPAVG
jgi:hypothetical protein